MTTVVDLTGDLPIVVRLGKGSAVAIWSGRMMELEHTIRLIALYAIPGIFAITLHEAAHGYAARHFGDLTAYQAGRHYAQSYPSHRSDGHDRDSGFDTDCQPGKTHSGGQNGSLSNFGRCAIQSATCCGWPLPARGESAYGGSLGFRDQGDAGGSDELFYRAGSADGARRGHHQHCSDVLNLLPLPPLDGGRIAVSLLPHGLAYRFAKVEPFGMIILLALMLLGVLGTVMWPLIAGL